MEAKVFHIGDMLSIYTGVLCLPNGIEGIYEILNHMTGTSLQTIQLPGAAEDMVGFLVEQHPWLKNITRDDLRPGVNLEEHKQEIQKLVEKYGEYHSVSPVESYKAPGIYDILKKYGKLDNPIVWLGEEE